MPTPILATKRHFPPPRPKVVLHPRLVKRLNEGLSLGCKLTLISASAGFGKTALVSANPHTCFYLLNPGFGYPKEADGRVSAPGAGELMSGLQ